MDRQTVIITGASDGIGAAAARQLAAAGERVVVVGRSKEKTAALAAGIDAPYHLADFAELAQVRRLAGELLAGYERIDVLANNAGGLFSRAKTTDGFDYTFQVNHLAPFLLTNLLVDRLVASHAKVIQTASLAARVFGRIDLDDLDNDRRWSANKAYGDGKLENILFTKELQHRYGGQGINAVAFHPGTIATNFANDTSSLIRFVYHTPLKKLFLTSPEKGGQALTWLAEGTPGDTWLPGEYYENNRLAQTNRQAYDTALAEGLWDRSAALVGA